MNPLPIDVVSIQSQVVYGRVGNNVALPVFAHHSLCAAAVPTVLLSNTPHYPTCNGGPMPDAWFAAWLDDLLLRGVGEHVRAVQLGYLGSPGQVRILEAWLRKLRGLRPRLQVLIDPVIGDSDTGIYVDPALVDAYRGGLLQLADGLTPNTFELGALAGMAVDSLDGIVAAARRMLHGELKWIIATSALPDTWPDGRMRMVRVSADEVEVLEHERIDAQPKGTGDLFSAWLNAALLRGHAMPDAIRLASDAVIRALHATRQAASAELLLEHAFTAAD
ncbi:pyridoxine/pyridoxal/pyridoxamine kinase [Luteimonas sp. e5]